MEIQLKKCAKKGRIPIIENLKVFTIVDEEFYDELNRYWWGLTAKGYAKRKERVNGKTINYSVHAEVMRLAGITKPDGDYSVDHISGNKLDNRLANLRWATRQEQRINAVRNRQLPRGVTKRRSRYLAQISSRVANLHEYLGVYDTPEEASEAFEKRFNELFPDLIKFRRA